MTAPQQQTTHVHLHGGPSDSDAAIIHNDPTTHVGHDVRVLDPSGHGLLVYGPVRQYDDGTFHADYVGGENEGAYTPILPPSSARVGIPEQ